MKASCQPCQRHGPPLQQQQQQSPRLLQHCAQHSTVRKPRGLRCRSSQHQNLYLVLEVPYDADASAIKQAFRAKAKLLHPDVNKAADAEAAFRLLKRAHEVLSDNMLRAVHDSELRELMPEASSALRARDPRFARWAGVPLFHRGCAVPSIMSCHSTAAPQTTLL